MVIYHFLSPNLCRLGKRYFLSVPRRLNHSLFSIIKMPISPFNHKTDTVNKPYLHINSLKWTYKCCFTRNKFRLNCHNCSSTWRLWEFVLCPLSFIIIFHRRKDTQFHKSFDKSWLTGSYRSYNTKIYFSIGSFLNIHIYIIRCTWYKLFSIHISNLHIYAYKCIFPSIKKYARRTPPFLPVWQKMYSFHLTYILIT